MPPGDLRAAFLRKPWHRFLNSSGETIPPFAVLRITGSSESHDDIRFTCAQPNSTQQAFYLVNGPHAVADGLDGLCTTLTGAGYVLYDSGSGTPAVGEAWGPQTGSWSLKKGNVGFFVAGGTRAVTGVGNACVAIQFPSGSGASLVKFRLTADLPIGDSAAAVIRFFNGAAYVDGPAILVYDWWGQTGAPTSTRGMFCGQANMEGWASKREVDSSATPEYDIVWMEQYARCIGFTATENMGATTADEISATIDYSFDQGVAPPAGTIIVHDDQELFQKALSGAKGWAIRNEYLNTDDPGDPYYQIWTCDQQVIIAYAFLSETMCYDDDLVGISGFVGETYPPYGQTPDPLPTEAYNLRKLSGKNGASVTLHWGNVVLNEGEEDEETISAWKIVQVEHREYYILVREGGQGPLRINAAKTAIEGYLLKITLQSCEDPQWGDIIPLEVCAN